MCKALQTTRAKIEKSSDGTVVKTEDTFLDFTEKGIKFTHVKGIFKCEQCGKKLKTRFTAKIHVFSHTKERPFSCKNCGQCFSHRSTLVNHRKIHKEPEFQCPNCLAWFARKANLKRHLRVVHKASEDIINRAMPKAKPGPRRKTPRRDLNFAPLHGVAYRGKLVPPISFDEDRSLGLSSHSQINPLRGDPTLRRFNPRLPGKSRESNYEFNQNSLTDHFGDNTQLRQPARDVLGAPPAPNTSPDLPQNWFDLPKRESEYRPTPPSYVALPPSIPLPPYEDPFSNVCLFPIQSKINDVDMLSDFEDSEFLQMDPKESADMGKESTPELEKSGNVADFENLFIPWTE